MKTIVYTALFFILTSINVFSQETSEPVRNKSNRIILHFKDTTGLFVRLSKDLVDKGYDMENRDREIGLIKTKPTEHPGGWSFKNEIKAVFRDSTIVLSDVMYSGGYTFDLFYVTRKGVIHSKAWSQMMEIANGLKPDAITYLEVK